jgi:hypothetical protein
MKKRKIKITFGRRYIYYYELTQDNFQYYGHCNLGYQPICKIFRINNSHP